MPKSKEYGSLFFTLKSVILYHNPKCSKSREVLSLLDSRTLNVEIKDYIKQGLEEDEVVLLSKKLELFPTEFIRKSETAYNALSTHDLSFEEWVNIICENPILLQRPIVVVGSRAVIARPKENALKLLPL